MKFSFLKDSLKSNFRAISLEMLRKTHEELEAKNLMKGTQYNK